MAQKLRCVVEQVVDHGERVYTVALRPERPAPRFRAGQFLHLALDPYDPTGFWPESRVFSIASPPAERELVRITYAVHGQFTARMESGLIEGKEVWIKMPYGDFIIERAPEVVLFAGGTGVTAFTAFLEDLAPGAGQPVTLAYGARTSDLLIYKDIVERCVARVPSLRVSYFVEQDTPDFDEAPASAEATAGQPAGRPVAVNLGRVSVDAVWPRLHSPRDASFYISGPPPMLRAIGEDLRVRKISPEAIHIDAWE